MSLIPEPAAHPTRRSRLVLAFSAFAVLYLLTIALAPVASADVVTADGDAPQLSFTFSWVLFLQLATGVLIPVIVGIVTTKATNAGTKAILLAFLSLVSSLLLEILNAAQTGTAYDVGQGLFLFLPTFVIAVATHYGFWKPTGTSAKVQELGSSERAT